MRVSFLGKGGSGKTTIASSFIKYLEKKGENVLAIDADMNVHLGHVLDMPVISLSDNYEKIENYLEGKRENRGKSINKKMPIIGTTPPSLSSTFIKIDDNDDFLKRYATKRNNLRLISVGTYNDSEVGYSCYHGKLGVAELIYNRLLDDKKTYVVSDATAGIDSVGTSMFFVSDVNVFVVEPTSKSVKVYKDFENVASNFNVKTYVIANKIDEEEDIEFIKANIDEDRIIGYVKNSNKLRKFEQGQTNAIDEFVDFNEEVYERLINIMKRTPRSWEEYYHVMLTLYLINAREWYNDYYGEDLSKFIDDDFSYKKVINND